MRNIILRILFFLLIINCKNSEKKINPIDLITLQNKIIGSKSYNDLIKVYSAQNINESKDKPFIKTGLFILDDYIHILVSDEKNNIQIRHQLIKKKIIIENSSNLLRNFILKRDDLFELQDNTNNELAEYIISVIKNTIIIFTVKEQKLIILHPSGDTSK